MNPHRAAGLLQLPPLGLYIHIPWCVRKCPYCDFNSHARKGELPVDDYVTALLEDLQHDLHAAQGRSLQSIFIGGGTPSLFPAEAYASLFENIRASIPFEDDIEITLEANPGTIEQERFRLYREAGINRLSLGIQSFNPAFLQTLGRIHDDQEALRAVDTAREAGFDNFNLDLMFGLPGQSQEQGLDDLHKAITCQPTHLSWYQLTLEPNTLFHRYPPPLPEDDDIASLFESGQGMLAEQGFRQYEVSAYARDGQLCTHNLNYWQFGDYLGIGAGAHGKVTLPAEQRIVRTRKTRQPEHYLSAIEKRVESQFIETAELPLEFMMNALRLNAGSSLDTFETRTGQSSDRVETALAALHARGLLEREGKQFFPSQRGRLYLNELLLSFM